MKSAFGLNDTSDLKHTIYCILTLKTFQVCFHYYSMIPSYLMVMKEYQQSANNAGGVPNQATNGEIAHSEEASIQGAVLLQCLLKMREPYNELILSRHGFN